MEQGGGRGEGAPQLHRGPPRLPGEHGRHKLAGRLPRAERGVREGHAVLRPRGEDPAAGGEVAAHGRELLPAHRSAAERSGQVHGDPQGVPGQRGVPAVPRAPVHGPEPQGRGARLRGEAAQGGEGGGGGGRGGWAKRRGGGRDGGGGRRRGREPDAGGEAGRAQGDGGREVQAGRRRRVGRGPGRRPPAWLLSRDARARARRPSRAPFCGGRRAEPHVL
mmetsp:Transcript_1667/g.5813  ORF Transcript_1667/g.5813 Transcript_1667/m.5813 type:complete len:220 (+) Transcript_1667:1780-2439(+)